jgi:hypothetical protein
MPKIAEKPESVGADITEKKKELTEAMKRDMESRATKAREEMEVILRKYNCVIMAMPRLEHTQNGAWVILADPVVRAMEPK